MARVIEGGRAVEGERIGQKMEVTHKGVTKELRFPILSWLISCGHSNPLVSENSVSY